MTVYYRAMPRDAVWTIPPSGWAFARSADPANRALPDAVLLRAGYVYLMRREGTRYVLAVEPQPPPAATGSSQATFLSEQRERWLLWAVDNALDPDAPSSTTKPWAVFETLADAAPVWQWERV